MRAKIIAPITLIGGLATGVAAGILLAPHKGTVTRGKIKQSMAENKERLEEKTMEAKAKANSTLKRARKN